MITLSKAVNNTMLWECLKNENSLINIIEEIRDFSISLTSEMNSIVPDFTDHSISHMDGLWRVADEILTEQEFSQLSVSESFILACSFYTHDIGMAYGIIKEGRETLEVSSEYLAAYSIAIKNNEEREARNIAIQYASRVLHSLSSRILILEKIPSLDRYLIENTDIRLKWANYIADVSESHNWPISVLAENIGKQNKIPDPLGGELDLAYVGCLLRIIDFSHINRDRASIIQKVVRSNMPQDSKKHWEAQESINGPKRRNDKLIFSTSKPITNVSAWWLIYETLNSLDKEIIEVLEFLNSRSCSTNRFSLEGVQGCLNPQTFSQVIQTNGFEPVDIRFRPDSIERLVSILGGKQLYANDLYAPIRELLQNSIDAIELKKATIEMSEKTLYVGEIKIKLINENEKYYLEIEDNGIGMSQEVITKYLLGIASDFWNSSYFNMQYQEKINKKYLPIGKFGIGFLSIFMIGDQIEVKTQKFGSQNLVLSLEGIGTHGAITKYPQKEKTGTKIKILISKIGPSKFKNLVSIIKARAPMIQYPVSVESEGNITLLNNCWWKDIGQDDFFEFIDSWYGVAFGIDEEAQEKNHDSIFRRRHYNEKFSEISKKDKWIGKQPEIVNDQYRVMAIPGMSTLLICNKGIAIRKINISGICGIASLENIEISASRDQIIDFNYNEFREKIILEMETKIIESLDKLIEYGIIQDKYPFIIKVAKEYGGEFLKKTIFPWICYLKPNGETVYSSYKSFMNLLEKSKSIVIGYGTGPWTISKYANTIYPDINRDTILIPITDEDQPNFGSYSEESYIEGSLKEHFEKNNTYSRDNDGLKGSVLLMQVINCISESYNINVNDIISYKWTRYRTSYIFVKIDKE